MGTGGSANKLEDAGWTSSRLVPVRDCQMGADLPAGQAVHQAHQIEQRLGVRYPSSVAVLTVFQELVKHLANRIGSPVRQVMGVDATPGEKIREKAARVR